MKSLSLKNDIPKKLFKKELQHDEFDFFKNNQLVFKEMWKAQNHEFWIKFVTSLRNEVWNHSFYKPELSDGIFIEFLKKLIGKSYDALLKHISNIGQKLKISDKKSQPSQESSESEEDELKNPLSQKIKPITIPEDQCAQRAVLDSKCIGAFIRLHTLWIKAVDGTDVPWNEPANWTNPNIASNPFEDFLRSRWSDSLLKKLGKTEEQLGWWKCSSKLTGSKPAASTSTQTSARSGKNQTTTQASVKQKSTKKLCKSKNHTAPIQTKQEESDDDDDESTIFKKERSENWLPMQYSRMKYIILTQTNEIKNYNFYQTLNNRQDGFDHKWFALERLVPPILCRKYCTVDPVALHQITDYMHHMGVATWFVTWLETYSLPLMALIRDYFIEFNEIETGDDILSKFMEFMNRAKWFPQVEKLIVTVSQTCAHWSKPGMKDTASTPEEFLLEPCILIQLPWSPIILQQWLSVALLQIMKFESASVELRHWPLKQGVVEECARRLLWLVSRAKERVLLGLHLLATVQRRNKGPDAKYTTLIMDSVVLPSVPVLRFLCSTAMQILEELKTIAFSQPYSLVDTVVLSPAVYLIHDRLQEFFVSHHWHAQYWLDDEDGDPFPLMKDQGYAQQILQQMKAGPPPPSTKKPATTSTLSKEETVVHRLWITLNFENKVLGDVLKSIANPKRIIKILIKFGYFLETDEEQLTMLILGNRLEREFINSFVKHSEIFAVTTFPLTGIDENESVLSWIVRLTGEVLEREQLARLTAMCGLLLNRAPSLPANVSKSPTHKTEELLALVQGVQDDVDSASRDWLWEQLPESWRQTVIVGNTEPSLSEDVTSIVASLATRVGRMIAGLASQSFVHQKCLWEGFKQWPVVQYMVPGYLTSLLEADSNGQNTKANQLRVRNLVKFLHTMIQYYEKMYVDWLQGGTHRSGVQHLPQESDREFARKYIFATSEGKFFEENVAQLMYAYIGLGNEFEGLPGYEALLDGIMWPMTSQDDNETGKMKKITSMAWINMGYIHFQDLYKICHLAWHVPVPGTQLAAGPVLSRIYLASAVLDELGILITLQGLVNTSLTKNTEYMSIVKNVNNSVGDWRYTLKSLIVQSEGLLPMEKDITLQQIELFASDGQNLLLEYWHILARLRNSFITWKEQNVKLPSDMFKQIKVQGVLNLFKKKQIDAAEKSMGIVHYSGEGAGVMRHLMKPLVSPSAAKAFNLEEIKKKLQLAEKAKNAKKGNIKHAHWCRRCHKEEKEPGSFLPCPECIKDKYPDMNFFCSTACKDFWWKNEHFADHLEFELGLSEFNTSQ